MLSWTSHPAAEESPFKTALVIVVIIATSLFAGFWMKDFYWSFISAIVLSFTMRAYFFKTEYCLNDKEIILKRLGRTSKNTWSGYRRVKHDDKGVFLAPYEKASATDAFRGLYLRCPGLVKEVSEFAAKQCEKR